MVIVPSRPLGGGINNNMEEDMQIFSVTINESCPYNIKIYTYLQLHINTIYTISRNEFTRPVKSLKKKIPARRKRAITKNYTRGMCVSARFTIKIIRQYSGSNSSKYSKYIV